MKAAVAEDLRNRSLRCRDADQKALGSLTKALPVVRFAWYLHC
ncbi:hypothetical protein BLSMQ_3566 [Brevibacterium aurantiacum]|uniref:Uncharacterized protein n=1 Tax=Brevibacterium aurantiacum TaxID=273384 RepID=A0A1D7W8E0_BREAU|nr:hypothetical protein BLSMQ_3566 [Brevibacterium aurantiacum]